MFGTLSGEPTINAFSFSSDNGVPCLLLYIITALSVGSEMACSVMTKLIDRVITTMFEEGFLRHG